MSDRRYWLIALAAIVAITLVRVIVLYVTPLEFYPDEAQYWWWSLTPDWGYFSKPPMVAWLIGATSSVCGDGEACVRLASPLLHGATALVLFGIARALYDARTGLWTSLLYLTLPGVDYSAGIVSTDVPLLFFWSVALLAVVRLSDPNTGNRWSWVLTCGAAIGLGLLSKYAMLYFVGGAALTAIILPEARRALVSLKGLAIVLIAAAIFAPNILWNVQHHFATVSHTAANANWSHAGLRLAGAGEFIAGQFGVFGPIVMIAYLIGTWRAVRNREDRAGRLLVCFSLPPLLIITVQSFISDANANWAAAAYLAGTPLAVHTLLTLRWAWVAPAAAAFNALAFAAFTMFAVSPAAVDAAGLANAYKRFHGWRALGQAVREEANAAHYDAVVIQNRSLTASLLYYARPLPIRVWDADAKPSNQFEATLMLTQDVKGPVLVIIDNPHPERLLATFTRSRLTREVSVPIGGSKVRSTKIFSAEGYRGPTAARPASR